MDGALVSLRSVFSRCVSRRRDPLSSEGARTLGGRFNIAGCPALYLASTPTLAVAESLQLGSMLGVVRFNPRLLVSVDVALHSVLDLTAEENLERMGLTIEDLHDDWRDGDEPTISQLIGAEARDSKVEAILYRSIIEPAASNLRVFRENLFADSRLVVDGYDDVWPQG